MCTNIPLKDMDRIGLVFDKKSTDIFAVAFVAPNNPAESSGFKKGEEIAMIDGKTIAECPPGDHRIPKWPTLEPRTR